MPWYGSHKYLNEFILKNRCKKILEIGVYNGENARSMIEAAMRKVTSDEVEYYGFDFFSHYSASRVERKLNELRCMYRLYRGNTRETLPEAVKTLPKMDIIFIDGGKSYGEATSDWKSSALLMHDGTGVFVHNVDFSGVGRMVDEIPEDRYEVEVFHAPSEGSVALIRKKPVSSGTARERNDDV
jgi:predicted O-methyltransferase YrrM